MNFQILQAGIDAANNAGISGTKIQVTNVKFGDAYGYTPDAMTDTDLRGTEVYAQAPTSFAVIDADTIEYTTVVNESQGPFSFGEVALELSNGLVFALATLPGLQEKVAAPGYGANKITIVSRVQYVGLSAVIEWVIQNIVAGEIFELASFSQLLIPSDAEANTYIVHSQDPDGNSAMCTAGDDDTWDVSTYERHVIPSGSMAASAMSVSSVTLSAAPGLPVTLPTRGYVIQFTSGTYKGLPRHLTTRSGNTLNWSPAFVGAPGTGDTFEILRANVLEEGNASAEALLHVLTYQHI